MDTYNMIGNKNYSINTKIYPREMYASAKIDF